MSLHVIKIPDIGEGIAEVELVAWHVKTGDSVTEDQGLADVMTDKATVEIPSPVAGKVVALGGEIGSLMAVGSELIRIEVEGAGERDAQSAAATAHVPPSQPSPGGGRSEIQAAGPAVSPSPSGGGQGWGRAANAPASPPPPSQPSPKGGRSESTGHPIASPSVRRQAWELGIDLKNVRPTGTAGRIMHADLEAHVAGGAASVRPPAAAALGQQREDQEKIPVIGLRRKIAQRMQEAKRHIPHFAYVEEVDVTELEALRARLNARPNAQRPRLTLLPFLMRAVASAVRDFPQLNAHFDDTAGVLTRYGAVHIGIATQTSSGLMVPVVRQAQALDLWASASEVARVADAARKGKATRDELSGSTITISSLGALGGIVSTPIINAPEVAIIGINRIALRPMMLGGAVVPRQMMNLSSSFDHRVIDGQVAAEFVQALRGLLECPATLFVE
ncbi:MAG TPA: dihydrolipoamide acetyltransferase family protein [Ramlibacter sp.]|nr:dihydrolipoamide acetyltransferase family protein [Ramlibacter sp.]